MRSSAGLFADVDSGAQRVLRDLELAPYMVIIQKNCALVSDPSNYLDIPLVGIFFGIGIIIGETFI